MMPRQAGLGPYMTLGIERPLPPMRGWPISPDFGREVVSLILRHRPNLVLELGSGVSTLVAGYALKKNASGRLVSVDHDEQWLEKTRALVEDHRLGEWVDLVHAPLTPVTVDGESWTWYDPDAFFPDRPIDLLVVDGPPVDTQPLARYPALPVLQQRLSAGAIVILDDADRPDEKEIVARWLARFPDLASTRLEAEKGCVILWQKAG